MAHTHTSLIAQRDPQTIVRCLDALILSSRPTIPAKSSIWPANPPPPSAPIKERLIQDHFTCIEQIKDSDEKNSHKEPLSSLVVGLCRSFASRRSADNSPIVVRFDLVAKAPRALCWWKSACNRCVAHFLTHKASNKPSTVGDGPVTSYIRDRQAHRSSCNLLVLLKASKRGGERQDVRDVDGLFAGQRFILRKDETSREKLGCVRSNSNN